MVSGTSPFPPDSPWGLPADQNGYVNFDVEKAKQEVAADLTDTGDSSLSLTLGGTPDTEQVRLMQLIQSQWQDAGIKVTIETKDAGTFITDVVGGNYQVALFNFYSSPDPDQDHYFWSAATAPGEGGININFTQYTTPQMEADLKSDVSTRTTPPARPPTTTWSTRSTTPPSTSGPSPRRTRSSPPRR